MRTLLLFCSLFFSLLLMAQKIPPTHFEQSGGTETPTYPEVIQWWQALDAASPIVKMQALGRTDAGYPLHLILVSGDGDFDISSIKRKGKAILFINNGIHPGEPDGIDASMLLVRDIVAKKQYGLLKNVVLAINPVYNIGGALNRSTNYRIDQNGPVQKGFRGNSENLDLNRDFIKGDSRDALSFSKLFHAVEPDVFIDTHVSNGADYQHVMTLLTTQHNKLGGESGIFLNTQMEPELYRLMKSKGFDLVPYVNHSGETPDKGWAEFWDSPRYSSGYAALWNTFSFMPETHMLKPYNQRVKATYALLQSFVEYTSAHYKELKKLRSDAAKQQQVQDSFTIAWRWDSTQHTNILFKGYQAGYKTSNISGLNRLY